jgi:hypothetical protein
MFLATTSLMCFGLNAHATTITLGSVKDSTLISDDSSQLALGAAYNIYAGRVGDQGGGFLRRGLIQFDFQSIPAGSVITSVQLKLYMSQSQGGTYTVSLNRSTLSWGEGASFGFGGGGAPAQAGDATWINRFYPSSPWPTPGGQFSSVASASTSVTGVAWYVWGSSARMVADVQEWVNQPTTNFGWGVLGNEVTLQSVKRFESRQASVNNPQLIVSFNPPAANPADLNNDGVVNGIDLAILLGAWNSSNPIADINRNGIVDGTDLTTLLASW